MGDVNSRICPMVHKNFHETVCFVCTTLGCVLLIHSCLYGKHTLVKKTKKETVPLTQLLFYSVTLCHTLLIPVSCSLSNHRLFLKLACSYLLSFSSYSYSFSNCSCYFLLPMVLFCFYFIGFFFLLFFSLQFLHQRALCSGRPLSMWSTSPVILPLVALILMLLIKEKKILASNDVRTLLFDMFTLPTSTWLLSYKKSPHYYYFFKQFWIIHSPLGPLSLLLPSTSFANFR